VNGSSGRCESFGSGINDVGYRAVVAGIGDPGKAANFFKKPGSSTPATAAIKLAFISGYSFATFVIRIPAFSRKRCLDFARHDI
jgi:hypothetical protein